MKRLQNIDINPRTGELNIGIMDKNSSFAIVVCNGRARLTELPDHGETKIVTHQGKVKRIKYDEGGGILVSMESVLTPRHVINNKQLVSIFKCSPQGGMRRSKDTNTLVIVSNNVESLYENKWLGGTLHYTGMGRVGDQSLEFMQNKTLNQSRVNGVEVHLFEVFKEQEYTYRGVVELAGDPYQERQLDEEGYLRLVWIFPLSLINESTQRINKETVKNAEGNRRHKARRMSDDELSKRAHSSTGQAGIRNTNTVYYQRDPYVAEYAKRWAKGICQLCENSAPFVNKKGEPFLHTHHIQWLSRGGEDTVENTIALCPNCHERMHVLNGKGDVEKLKTKVQQHFTSCN